VTVDLNMHTPERVRVWSKAWVLASAEVGVRLYQQEQVATWTSRRREHNRGELEQMLGIMFDDAARPTRWAKIPPWKHRLRTATVHALIDAVYRGEAA
jgi:hypothetical protein